MREERLSVGEGFLECLLPLEFTGQLRPEIQYGAQDTRLPESFWVFTMRQPGVQV